MTRVLPALPAPISAIYNTLKYHTLNAHLVTQQPLPADKGKKAITNSITEADLVITITIPTFTSLDDTRNARLIKNQRLHNPNRGSERSQTRDVSISDSQTPAPVIFPSNLGTESAPIKLERSNSPPIKFEPNEFPDFDDFEPPVPRSVTEHNTDPQSSVQVQPIQPEQTAPHTPSLSSAPVAKPTGGPTLERTNPPPSKLRQPGYLKHSTPLFIPTSLAPTIVHAYTGLNRTIFHPESSALGASSSNLDQNKTPFSLTEEDVTPRIPVNSLLRESTVQPTASSVSSQSKPLASNPTHENQSSSPSRRTPPPSDNTRKRPAKDMSPKNNTEHNAWIDRDKNTRACMFSA